MNKKILKYISLGMSVCMCLSLLGCSKDKTAGTDAEIDSGINVTVYEVSKDNINASSDYTGEIVGTESTAVSAKVSGEAKLINVKEGDYVNAGATLLTIDSTTYQLAFNQAKAAYNSALAGKKSAEASYNSVTGGSTQQTLNQLEAAFNAAKLAYDNALDIYNKQKVLYDMGAISQIEFNTYKTNLDNAKLNYDSAESSYNLTKNVVANESKQSAQAGVDSATAGIAQAKAALDIAENNLKNCIVTAPISGYISQKNVSRGQMVSPGVGIFTITNTSSVEVKINVTEAVIPLIAEGTKATVRVPSAKLENAEGIVSGVNPVKDAMSGLYTVKVAIPNEDGALKEGMIANISLVTEERQDTLTIPANAVMQSEEDEYYVYVAVGDIAEKRIIKTGVDNGEYIEILSGINIGDKVVVDGKEYISDENKKINIVTE